MQLAKQQPGTKQTEVGVIPADWDVKPLGELSLFATSGSRGWARYYSDAGALFVRSQNIRDGRLDFTDRQCVTPPTGSEGSRTRLQNSDLLITMTGNSVGNVAWVKQELGEAYISQHVGLVRLAEPSFAEFICLYLAPGSPGNCQISLSQTGQSKPGLNLKNLEDFRIALPPLPEQRAITNAISETGSLIESLEQLIAKKRQIKHGTMQDLLTGKRRLPGFNGKWETKRLGELLTICHGKSQRSVQARDGEFPILATGGEIGRANQFLYDKPSVLIGRKGTINRPQYMETPFWSVDTLFFSVVHEPNNAKFIFYRFCLVTWDQHNEASGVPSLNARTIEKIEILAPTHSEQSAIAAILSDMDAEIGALEAKLAKARQVKQGMMQELLTGRTRLV